MGVPFRRLNHELKFFSVKNADLSYFGLFWFLFWGFDIVMFLDGRLDQRLGHRIRPAQEEGRHLAIVASIDALDELARNGFRQACTPAPRTLASEGADVRAGLHAANIAKRALELARRILLRYIGHAARLAHRQRCCDGGPARDQLVHGSELLELDVCLVLAGNIADLGTFKSLPIDKDVITLLTPPDVDGDVLGLLDQALHPRGRYDLALLVVRQVLDVAENTGGALVGGCTVRHIRHDSPVKEEAIILERQAAP